MIRVRELPKAGHASSGHRYISRHPLAIQSRFYSQREMEMVLEVVRDEKETKELEEALREMLGNPKYSDVVLVCEDGSRVHACKLLLMARSPLFCSMFSSGMAESRQAEIVLPSIPSRPILLLALQYLYTGAIAKEPINMDMAFQLLHAVHFLILPHLEDRIVANMLEPAILHTSDPALLVQHFSSIVGSPIADSPRLDKVIRYIVRILRKTGEASDGMSRRHLWYLPWLEMQVYLEKSKTRNDVPSLSIMEYMRLRDILMWAACHMSPEAEHHVLSCLPHEEHLAHSLKFQSMTAQPTSQPLPSVMEHRDTLEKLKVFLSSYSIDWSQVVNLRAIHPALLVRIVKPLNVIEPSALFEECLFYQALHMMQMKMMMWVPTTDQWKRYRVEENGCLLIAMKGSEIEDFYGSDDEFVKANRAFNKTTGTYVFDVFIQEKASDLAIGVAGMPFKSGEGAFLRVTDGRIWYDEQGTYEERWPRGDKYRVGEGSCITVHVDMKNCSCGFSVNGNRLRRAEFNYLPEEVFPFAYSEPPGKLRITLCNNADSL